MFERRDIRGKFRAFVFALFGEDEEAFYSFCRRVEVDYFVYEFHWTLFKTPDSDRYLTNRISLKKSSLAYRFHFRPQTLQRFQLVHQNLHYRVFRILSEKEGFGERRRIPLFYQPTFDEKLFSAFTTRDSEAFDDASVEGAFRAMKAAKEHTDRGNGYLGRREYLPAAQEYLLALDAVPDWDVIHFDLGSAWRGLGRYEEAIAEFQRALAEKDDFVAARYYLALCLQETGRTREAAEEYVRFLEVAALDPEWHNEAARVRDWLDEAKSRIKTDRVKKTSRHVRLRPREACLLLESRGGGAGVCGRAS
jgi:tetratricopeptide (TPR) repeat protein